MISRDGKDRGECYIPWLHFLFIQVQLTTHSPDRLVTSVAKGIQKAKGTQKAQKRTKNDCSSKMV